MKDIRNKDGLTEAEFLKNYKPGDYERPSVTVDILVLGMSKKLDGLKVLLIQRKDHPYINCWALPGGFVNMDESAYEAACRELEEETGLTGVYLEQLYTMSKPDRDPRMRIIDLSYIALIPTVSVIARDDAKDALWFDVTLSETEMIFCNEERNIKISYKVEPKFFKNGIVTVEGYVPVLESEDALAFDHAEIILEGLLRIRNKVIYSDIAFNLLPEEFTLPDLQSVYEKILGRELYKTNFRSNIADKIISVGRKGTSSVPGGKKSYLYKYKGKDDAE